jgi:hypothetical protein
VLKIFKGEGGDHPEALGAAITPLRHSSSCLDTPSVQRTIRRIVNEAVAERNTETKKVIRKLGGVCLTLSAKLKLAEDREKGHLEALNSEKKKSLEQRKVLVCCSLVLLRFRKLESFRMLRKLLESGRLLTRSLELKPELPQRFKKS